MRWIRLTTNSTEKGNPHPWHFVGPDGLVRCVFQDERLKGVTRKGRRDVEHFEGELPPGGEPKICAACARGPLDVEGHKAKVASYVTLPPRGVFKKGRGF